MHVYTHRQIFVLKSMINSNYFTSMTVACTTFLMYTYNVLGIVSTKKVTWILLNFKFIVHMMSNSIRILKTIIINSVMTNSIAANEITTNRNTSNRQIEQRPIALRSIKLRKAVYVGNDYST